MSVAGDEDTPEMVEAIAKQLFRAENPPSILWDDALFVRAGLPTEGYMFASEEKRNDYRERARSHLTDTTS